MNINVESLEFLADFTDSDYVPDGEKLKPWTLLSKVFTDTPEGDRVHIIIERPSRCNYLLAVAVVLTRLSPSTASSIYTRLTSLFF